MAHNLFFCDSGKCPIDFLRFRSFVLKVLVRRRSTGSALYVPVISKNGKITLKIGWPTLCQNDPPKMEVMGHLTHRHVFLD